MVGGAGGAEALCRRSAPSPTDARTALAVPALVLQVLLQHAAEPVQQDCGGQGARPLWHGRLPRCGVHPLGGCCCTRGCCEQPGVLGAGTLLSSTQLRELVNSWCCYLEHTGASAPAPALRRAPPPCSPLRHVQLPVLALANAAPAAHTPCALHHLHPPAAPFLMSSCQFFFQHLIARAVLMSGLVGRKSDGSQSWQDYFRKGGWMGGWWWGGGGGW